MAGGHEFNEVVFEDTFVPSDLIVGEPGNGWDQVTSELAYERSGPERYLSCIRLAEATVHCAGPSPAPAVRETIGRLVARLISLRTMSIAVAAQLQNGEMPNLEAALIKDLGNAFEREQVQLIQAIQGDLESPDQEFLDAMTEASVYYPSWALRGGTREILRGIVARGLGIR